MPSPSICIAILMGGGGKDRVITVPARHALIGQKRHLAIHMCAVV